MKAKTAQRITQSIDFTIWNAAFCDFSSSISYVFALFICNFWYGKKVWAISQEAIFFLLYLTVEFVVEPRLMTYWPAQKQKSNSATESEKEMRKIHWTDNKSYEKRAHISKMLHSK